jgi:methylenetetrahydrofolate reductase (NADPH)
MPATAQTASAPGVRPGTSIARLAREGSLEVSDVDFQQFAAARAQLRPGQRVFVSHLPGQSWARTFDMCASLAGAGFDPVPHVPVRLLRSRVELAAILRHAREVGVREPLLISGDYREAAGPYSSVLDVLQSDELPAQGFARVAFAGHPEGHPAVPAQAIRAAQLDKWRRANELGLEVTFVTQFFFTAEAFTGWARDLRTAGVRARLVAGLAGPVGLGKLVRLAARCGVGTSMRALMARATAAVKLLADHDPMELLRELSSPSHGAAGLPDGIHLFAFGGLLRTAAWLRRCELESGPGEA